MKTFLAVLVIVMVFVEAPGLQLQAEHMQDHLDTSLGAISGKVLYQDGKPVSGARVCPSALDRADIGRLPQTFTNDKGEFIVTGLLRGHYEVPAAKENEGYPEMLPIFYGISELAPRVEVRAGKVTAGVVVRLGSKASRLVGRIEDASTHQEIEAGIDFYAAESPASSANDKGRLYFTTSSGNHPGNAESGHLSTLGRGEFNILVPSKKPFWFKITAPGYEPWYYGADGSQKNATPIRMSGEATRQLVILLRPLKKKSQQRVDSPPR